MTDQTLRTATCGCGALSVKTTGAPERAMLCSCRSFQDRTGSGISLSTCSREDQSVTRGAFDDGDFPEPAKACWASLRPGWVDRIHTVETLDRQDN